MKGVKRVGVVNVGVVQSLDGLHQFGWLVSASKRVQYIIYIR